MFKLRPSVHWQLHRLWTTRNRSVLMGSVCVELTLSPYVALILRADITQMERHSHTAQPICNTCINGIYNHHGTPTLFLMNFTKTVKLTKTPITCHYRGWNSFSCDHLKNHENYWKGDFQINILELHVRLQGHILNSIHCTALLSMHVERYTSVRFAGRHSLDTVD